MPRHLLRQRRRVGLKQAIRRRGRRGIHNDAQNKRPQRLGRNQVRRRGYNENLARQTVFVR